MVVNKVRKKREEKKKNYQKFEAHLRLEPLTLLPLPFVLLSLCGGGADVVGAVALSAHLQRRTTEKAVKIGQNNVKI